jgi:antitoxin FitA
MPSLTIRNLDEPLKRRLRLRAAAGNRSMEEEARQILRSALADSTPPAQDLGERIQSRFAVFGGVKLPIAAREPIRTPPSFGKSDSPAQRAVSVKKPVAARKRGGAA